MSRIGEDLLAQLSVADAKGNTALVSMLLELAQYRLADVKNSQGSSDQIFRDGKWYDLRP